MRQRTQEKQGIFNDLFLLGWMKPLFYEKLF